MNKHCAGCKFHHNAGHDKNAPLAKTYNDWCSRFSKTARKAVGECKLKNGKEEFTDSKEMGLDPRRAQIMKAEILKLRNAYQDYHDLRERVEAHNARLRRDCEVYGNASCKQTIGPPSICLKCPRRGVIILPESIE